MGIASNALIVLSSLAVTTAACADVTRDGGVQPPTDEEYANTATSLGTAVAHEGTEVAAMRTAFALARGETPASLTSGGDGAFRGTSAGLDYRYDLACHTDAAAAPCSGTTDGAEVEATWTGGFDLPHLAVTISHDARWQLTGMVGSIAHIDGTGQLAYDTRDDASSYHYQYDATYHVIVNDQRAIGGTIALSIAAEHRAADAAGGATRKLAITAQLTFAPDDTAELVLDGSRHYRIALATGAVTALDAGSLASRAHPSLAGWPG
jgi:hypothetical protein